MYLLVCSLGICLGIWIEYNLLVTFLGQEPLLSAGGICRQTDLQCMSKHKRERNK